MASSFAEELASVEAEIARLETVRDWLRERAPQNGSAPPASRTGAKKASGRVTAAVAAEAVLVRAGGPMRTPDLLKAIRDEGARMKDTDSLYKTLSRSARFKKAGRGMWTLA